MGLYLVHKSMIHHFLMKTLVISHVTLVSYELTGSDTRTCQSNGSWSGTNAMCTRGNNDVKATH